MQPTITHFHDGDGETEHVYVGRTLTFDVDHERSVLARIYDDRPHVATLVNVSHRQVEESSVADVMDWLRAAGMKTVEVMGPDGLRRLAMTRGNRRYASIAGMCPMHQPRAPLAFRA